MTDHASSPAPHKRRRRYSGRYPRRFEDKYKERQPELYPDTVAKVLASGKTPAGTHRPIIVTEILEVLRPLPGDVAVDATLGYGGHSREILARIQPGGCLIGLDVDLVELPRTGARLRGLGFGPDLLRVPRCNFAGLPGGWRPSNSMAKNFPVWRFRTRTDATFVDVLNADAVIVICSPARTVTSWTASASLLTGVKRRLLLPT